MVNPDDIETILNPNTVNVFKYIKMSVDTFLYGFVWVGGAYLIYRIASNTINSISNYYENKHSAEAMAKEIISGELEDRIKALEKQMNTLSKERNKEENKYPIPK